MAKITVRATDRGYYGQLREPGDVFQIHGKKHMGKWMEEVTGEEETAEPEPVHPLDEGTDDESVI